MRQRFVRVLVSFFYLLSNSHCDGNDIIGSSHHKKGGHHHEKSSNSTAETVALAIPTNPGPVPPPDSILFYSFFVSMEKSAGYALPFANKLCYMGHHDYRWMLDVVKKDEVPKRKGSSGSLHMAPTWYKPGGIAKWLERVDYLVYLDMDLVGEYQYHQHQRTRNLLNPFVFVS
jgi:hypothetical protein